MKWTILLIAIGLEINGTVLLKISNGGQKLGLILTALMLYSGSLWFLSIALKYMRMNVAYANWSGLGLILLTFIQSLFFKKQLTF
jgi:small multidrug resistance pump